MLYCAYLWVGLRVALLLAGRVIVEHYIAAHSSIRLQQPGVVKTAFVPAGAMEKHKPGVGNTKCGGVIVVSTIHTCTYILYQPICLEGTRLKNSNSVEWARIGFR